VYVKNTVGEAADELDRIDTLPVEVAGVEGEAKLLAPFDRLQSHFRAEKVESDLAGMHLEGEADAGLAARIQDRPPLPRERLEAGGDLVGIGGRIAGDE